MAVDPVRSPPRKDIQGQWVNYYDITRLEKRGLNSKHHGRNPKKRINYVLKGNLLIQHSFIDKSESVFL